MSEMKKVRRVLDELVHKETDEAFEILSEMKSSGEITMFETFDKNGHLNKIVVFAGDCCITVWRND